MIEKIAIMQANVDKKKAIEAAKLLENKEDLVVKPQRTS